MPQNETLKRAGAWPRWQAVIVLLLLCFFMAAPAAPERWADLYAFYGKTMIFALVALFFYLRRWDYPWEIRLVALYAVWLAATRFLNSDHYLIREPNLILTKFMLVPVISWAMLLDEKGRRRFMAVFSFVVGGFYMIGGLLALYANLLDTYFYLPPENVLFGLDGPWHLHYINVFNTNRTISAMWFYIALSLMVYQFFACKNKLWRVPICLAGLVHFLCISLAFSRTVKLVTAISLVMLAMLLVLRYLPVKKIWLKAAALLLCLVLVLPLGLKSFDLSASLMSSLSAAMQTQAQKDESGTAAEEAAGVDLSDDRDLKKDISNLSERGQIFRSVMPSLKLEPKRIFIGSFADKLMTAPNKFVDFPIPFTHMHNFLLEVLMLTGVPGAILVVAFCIMLVLRMLKIFFTEDERVSMAHKVLTIPLAGTLLYGMSEIVIFTSCADRRAPTDIRELSFFILAGLLLAVSYDIFPPKKKHK